MAGAGEDHLEDIERYARSLGTVFQIQDDKNEIQSAANLEENYHGKGESDLYQGKATPSFTTAYSVLDREIDQTDSQEDRRDLEHQKARLEHHYGNSGANELEMQKTAEAILEHQRPEHIAEEYIDEALEYLEDADPSGDSSRLMEFVYFMKEREY